MLIITTMLHSGSSIFARIVDVHGMMPESFGKVHAHHTESSKCCLAPMPLASCCNLRRRMALFGMAIQVFFESTTPLLHLLGCLKIAGRTRSRAYLVAGAQMRCCPPYMRRFAVITCFIVIVT